MYPRTRRKKRTESMQVTAGEHDSDEEDDDYHSYISRDKSPPQRRDRSTTVPNSSHAPSLSSLAVPLHHDNVNQNRQGLAIEIAQLFQDSGLSELLELDWFDQIRFLLNERSTLNNQLDFIRTQFEKQYNALKRRLDETETENERLTAEHRTATKELLLYKTLLEAPADPNSPNKSKDYQQLRITIDAVLKENDRLHSEIQEFKTSDPVYEQVQLLETATKNLKQELIQTINQNNRLKKMINLDEIKHLKSRLRRTNEECEQMRLLNKKLIAEIDSSRHRLDERTTSTSSEQPIRLYSSSPVLSQRSSTVVTQQIPPLTRQNLRQFEFVSQYPLVISSNSADIEDLHQHVRELEGKLQQRDYELQTLQIEIEKGTSSIMSSIEDLCLASASVSPTNNVPVVSNIDELQNQLDQLHDKLDDLTRENQTLRNRAQEFDTIYEENEYLYAEKSQWKEEIERARVRELILEQEISTLKQRENDFLQPNDSESTSQLNPAQMKIKIDWLYQTNNKLDLEIANLREQLQRMATKCQELKKELNEKNKHYQQLLNINDDQQQIPQELIRLERIKFDLEHQLERQREEYEKTIAILEEQSDKREEKYSSLYETILKLQNDYRQKELDYVQQMDEVLQQRNDFHQRCQNLEDQFQLVQQEKKSFAEEVKSKEEINRDLKLALASSNNDTQTIYNQLRQLKTSLVDLEAKSREEIEKLQNEQKQINAKHDDEILKAHQTIIQMQHENNQLTNQCEMSKSNLEKFQKEIEEKQRFIEQMQSDLSERSALHVNINSQLSQENKTRLTKINELEQMLNLEQQRKIECQRTIQDLQNDLIKSRALAKESMERCQELERRFQETDKHLEETMRIHWNETNEPTRRELTALRTELMNKADQIIRLQQTIDEEQLKRQRLEMKIKRLKDEYINVRKELSNRIEENNSLRHELVECRLKNDYNHQLTNQTFHSLKSINGESETSTAVQLYIKEKTDKEHWQLKCRTAQQKFEQSQKNYEAMKEKYKQRLHGEREIFERTKTKYLEHIKNVQRDLHETRQLIEKDAELKFNQETAYQQLIDERRQLLTSMVDKDAKVREMRRENLLLTSKIQLLEDQMENLNDRVDRTLRERNQIRREINTVRYDSNLSIETSARSSSSASPTRTTTYIDSTSWNPAIHHKESFGFHNGHSNEALPNSSS